MSSEHYGFDDPDFGEENIVSGDGPDGSVVFTCWCGARGTFEELCDSDVFDENCGGSGHMECLCGGDFCVCHNHGKVECPGCPDCKNEDDEDYYDPDDDDTDDD